MGTGTSIVLIAVGAILRFAVSANAAGLDLHTAGVIVLMVGVFCLLLSLLFMESWNAPDRGGGHRRTRRVARDGAGGTLIEERSDHF